MRKDIKIPKVKDVYIAAIREYNEAFKTYDWNAYIINDKDTPIDVVFIVSVGHKNEQKTATMRHKLEQLKGKSYARFEFLEDSVLELINEFKVSFFDGNMLFDKTYTFKAHSIHEDFQKPLPLIGTPGILAA